jgi:hypothetical protein
MKLITIRNACHFQSILHYQIEEREKNYVWWKMQNIYQGFDEVLKTIRIYQKSKNMKRIIKRI